MRTKFRQYVPRRDQESIDLARKLYAVRDSGTHYVENAIEGYVDDGALPGAISVACCDGEQEVSCLGWADVEQRRRMSLDSMFMIASQSKGVCGVAVAMLIEEGVLFFISAVLPSRIKSSLSIMIITSFFPSWSISYI